GPMVQPAPDVPSADSAPSIRPISSFGAATGLPPLNTRVSPPLEQPSRSQNTAQAPNVLAAAPRLTPQQDGQTSQDVSMTPVSDRRSAILDQTPNTTPDTNSPAPNSRMAAAEARRAQLEDRFAKLLQLEGEEVKDENGRLKSGLLGALRGFLTNGIVGAAYGGVRGAVKPEWDEQIKQASTILKERGKLKEAMEIENEFARLDAMQTRTDATAQKNSPEARAAKDQKA